MSRFNVKESNKTENLAGGKSFSKDAKSELVFAVLTTFLEDKFYESGDERIERIKNLIPQVGADFACKLAIVARQEFNMRSVSHLLIGEISKIYKGVVKDIIPKIAVRPDDLIEICAYLGKPLPNQVKKGVALSLNNFSEYQLGKYRKEGSKWSLVDLFNLTHPKGNKHAKKLIDGVLKADDTWEQEVSKVADARTWENLISEDKMGYMAILRNLNNLVKYDVSDKTIEKVCNILTDQEQVKKSRQLPFRFYTAYTNVTGNIKLSDAISEAMDISVGNLDELKGKTLIAVDSSGSMSGKPIEIASIFAGALIKKTDCEVVLYDTSLKEFAPSTRTPVVDIADRIQKEAMGGGTQTSLVFEYAEKGQWDRIFILSDNESWNEFSVQKSYNQFKRITGSDPFIYAIDIEGYGTHDISGGKVTHLTGWSDKLLQFINIKEKGVDIVKWIENLPLQ
jgi:hypothetical protein